MAHKLKKRLFNWRKYYLSRSRQFTPGNINSLTQTHNFPLSDLNFIYHTPLYFLSLLGFLGANSKHQDPRFSSANKVGVKSSNKLITVNADKDLFVKLLISSNLPERCAELWLWQIHKLFLFSTVLLNITLLKMGFIVVQWENENSVSIANEKKVVGAVELKEGTINSQGRPGFLGIRYSGAF